MKSFFECVGTNNNLQRSILFDLKVPEFIAGTKALSYISKFITCPLWSVLEDKTVSITDMNSKYLQVVTFLEDAIENIDQFMAGELCLFGQVHVERDYIVEHLLQPREYDNIVQSHLEVTLLAICGLARRLYKDHLPGGKVVGVDPKKVRSVPKTSSFAESVFGQLDQIMRTKPSISTLAAESCIMFLNNKTSEWLKSKKEHERKELIENASKNVKNVKAAYKNRLCEIKQNRRLKQQELMMKKQHLERERVERQTKYTENMIRHGLWQSTEEVENMLASYQSEIEKVEALKAQLKFRKEVLNQVAETKSQFNLTKGMKGSKKRKKLTVDELKENLINIVKQALVKDRENDEEIHILVGKRVRHRFEEVTDGKKMYKWYNGRIISQVPGFREWFNIIYDSDDSIYTYHRLDSDVETADLQIIV
ncbi:uncharacterized protein LOC132717769 [Ruditapes philippinarum]|uniref:uncharacterized protein LOC132717769 n=1 Tax=Ruditapes philippinarum TaxID=129788 RepID=UPI00295B4397|nr:uncharacterized protein LOC132717769 [Ruditapes philippinarum]